MSLSIGIRRAIRLKARVLDRRHISCYYSFIPLYTTTATTHRPQAMNQQLSTPRHGRAHSRGRQHSPGPRLISKFHSRSASPGRHNVCDMCMQPIGSHPHGQCPKKETCFCTICDTRGSRPIIRKGIISMNRGCCIETRCIIHAIKASLNG